MLVTQEWFETLSILDKDFIKGFMDSDSRNVQDNEPPIISDTLENTCPHCHGNMVIKNGHARNKRQRYLCRECGKSYTAATASFFKHSRISYETWLEVLDCEMAGYTLRETAYRTGLSVPTCFYLRHKIYGALEKEQANILTGTVQLDTTFVSIDLKGLKLMPKPVKGSKKNPPAQILFDKEPKVCITTASDNSGNILFRISGTGGESFDKYEQTKDLFDQNCTIVSDCASSIIKFTKSNNLAHKALTEGYHKLKDGSTISDVNSLHSSLKDLIRKKRGVSLRHLQGYLNWIVFKKKISNKLRSTYKLLSYASVYTENRKYKNEDICEKEFPISLREIYGKYKYGMFSPTLKFN